MANGTKNCNSNDRNTLKFASYNVQGLNAAKWPYIRDVFSSCDFLFMQETWLHENQSHLFADNLPNVNFHSVSGMDDSVLLQGRPHGGCCIAWHDNIVCCVSVHTQSRRVCAVKVVTDLTSVLLCTVYMPCDTTHDVNNQVIFDESLNELISIADLENVSSIIIGGDFNTDLSRSNSLHTLSVERLVACGDVSLLNNLPGYDVDYTYESVMSLARSTIDHFLVSCNLIEYVQTVSIEHSADNLSDHSVLSLLVQIPVRRVAERPRQPPKPKPVWHRASADNIDCYQRSLDALLSRITEPRVALQCTDRWCTRHHDDLEAYHRALVDACISAGKQCIPHTSEHPTGSRVPGWSTHIRPLKEDAHFWHALWKSCGRPATGVVASIRRATRARYHKAIRWAKRNEEMVRFASMGEHFLSDQRREFWTEVKKIKGNSSCTPSTVDGKQTEEEIAGVFQEKYRELYNSVSYDFDKFLTLSSSIDHNVRNHCDDCNSHRIQVYDVRRAVEGLKKGKHDGNLGQYSDHLIYSTPRFQCCLSLLLNSLLTHNVVPENILLSTVSPIPKNKRKSMNQSNNYRAIALSCVIGKLLDKVILSKCQELTDTSQQQFGFKKAHSTTQCTFIVNEVVQLYNSSGSDVYIALLDASRAFDRVEYIKLFEILMSRGICPIVTRFLLTLYTGQRVRVRWGSVCSDSFTVTNGVKQGGVISPLLFTLYLDSLLTRLSALPCGCRVGSVYCGAMGYADDVVLLSPSLYSLRKQLETCSVYADEFNVQFNAGKSKLIVASTSPRADSPDPQVQFMGGRIEVGKYGSHLGTTIGNTTPKAKIDAAVADFTARVNMMLRHFKWLRPAATYSLFQSHCMPLYGSVLWDLSHPSIERFYVAWRKAVRRLLHLPPRTHGYLLPEICADRSVGMQLSLRLIKFMRSASKNGNPLLAVCAKLAVDGSGSAVSNSLSVVSRSSRMSRHAIVYGDQNPRLFDTDVESDRSLVGLIRDLLELRHSTLTSPEMPNDASLTLNDIDFSLTALCCG